jgi:dihydrofolate synthase / folylpolyglutamate synthase
VSIEAILDLLGSPQRAYPAIQVTGTHGKTSTAHMIESLIRAHGLRTGSYTNPHWETDRERIRIDGVAVSEEKFAEIREEVAPVVQFLDGEVGVAESHGEGDLTTAMALAAFADAPVDVAVVEVAGRDSAEVSNNVLRANTCVITPIALDDIDWPGDTVADIAAALAGGTYRGSAVVCATQSEEAMSSILERVEAENADETIVREGSDFGVLGRGLAVGGQRLALQGLGGVYDEIFLPLHGAHQAQNAAVALAAVEAFLGAGPHSRQLDLEIVREGFAAVTMPGHLERARISPTILLDAAHDAHSMTVTVTALREEFSFSHLVAVLAVLEGQDVSALLELLEPVVDSVVLTRNTSPRALPIDRLADIAVEIFGEERVRLERDMPDAIEAAVNLAETEVEGELAAVGVLITGSVATVADARRLLVR